MVPEILSTESLLNHFTPTESTARRTLLYIADHLTYQRRNDLNIYQKNYLESTFTEVTNLHKTNIIVGCIYRHPTWILMNSIVTILIQF